MDVRDRIIDVELTNRCNALCSFCPRSETPEQGFMTFDTFKQVIAQVKELKILPWITLTGQGESTLHPQLVEFVAYAKDQGTRVRMTTNGNRLEPDMAQALLDAGLDGICFSVSDMGDDYQLVYNLDFDRTRRNIIHFVQLAKEADRDVEIMLSIVKHDLNRDKVKDMVDYWRSIGITQFLGFDQNNRGGACDNGHYFLTSDKYKAEATQLLADGKATSLCFAAFHFAFIGWSGQYYICCSDYRKMDPLGSVHEYSIGEMDHIKLSALASARLAACAECSLDPVNAVREVLFEIEHGEKEQSDLNTAIKNRAGTHALLPRDIDVLAWDASLPKEILARQR